MAWDRRWLIDSREKLSRLAKYLAEFSVDFSRHPFELVFREEAKPIDSNDRRHFHAVCGDLAPLLGLTPGAVKRAIKEEFYGVEMVVQGGRLSEDEALEFQRLLSKVGPYELVVQSSEISSGAEYRRLRDFAYQYAAERGFNIPDRRLR